LVDSGRFAMDGAVNNDTHATATTTHFVDGIISVDPSSSEHLIDCAVDEEVNVAGTLRATRSELAFAPVVYGNGMLLLEDARLAANAILLDAAVLVEGKLSAPENGATVGTAVELRGSAAGLDAAGARAVDAVIDVRPSGGDWSALATTAGTSATLANWHPSASGSHDVRLRVTDRGRPEATVLVERTVVVDLSGSDDDGGSDGSGDKTGTRDDEGCASTGTQTSMAGLLLVLMARRPRRPSLG
jgi:hypothetical protein